MSVKEAVVPIEVILEIRSGKSIAGDTNRTAKNAGENRCEAGCCSSLECPSKLYATEPFLWSLPERERNLRCVE